MNLLVLTLGYTHEFICSWQGAFNFSSPISFKPLFRAWRHSHLLIIRSQLHARVKSSSISWRQMHFKKIVGCRFYLKPHHLLGDKVWFSLQQVKKKSMISNSCFSFKKKNANFYQSYFLRAKSVRYKKREKKRLEINASSPWNTCLSWEMNMKITINKR